MRRVAPQVSLLSLPLRVPTPRPVAASAGSLLHASLQCATSLTFQARLCSQAPTSPPLHHAKGDSLERLHHYSVPETAPIGIPKPVSEIRQLTSFPQDRIRNFSIIAHIDHGKTTLSDAILRRCDVLDRDGEVSRFLDKLEVERERGITIKAQTCSFFVKSAKDGKEYLINLIDTPGHVDFQYEVSRSLGASEGAVLLVDATQGVEAQTMANFYLALDANLDIIPALTKLDAVMNEKSITDAISQMEDSTGLLGSETILTAARAKRGVEAVLEAVIERVRAPCGDEAKPARGLLFDCWTNPDTKVGGVVCLIRVIDGKFVPKMGISLLHSKKRVQIESVGMMQTESVPCAALAAGMVGYVVLPTLDRRDLLIGDTFGENPNVEPIPGFKIVKPMVFAGFFPDEAEIITNMQEAVENLRINDPSVTVELIKCPALGPGLQLGFLGMLHMQVFQERLFAEYGKKVLVTPAQVQYQYEDKNGKAHPLSVYNWKWKHEGAEKYLEPMVKATVVCQNEYFQDINSAAISEFRAECIEMRQIDSNRMVGLFRMPLADLARGFFSFVKQTSHGFGTLEYDDPTYEESDLVKIDVLVNRAEISALSTITPRSRHMTTAKRLVSSLKEHLPPSIVDLPIQAMLSNKCIARETVGCNKKDVTAKIHAGDISRKRKKWDDQKKGKERLAKRNVGSAQIDQETLAAAMGATYFGGL